MPRKTRSLSGGTKVSFRSFTQLIRDLPAAENDRLQSAFSDAENLLDFHSDGVPERLQKRHISGLVQKLEIHVESSVLGGFVSWSRLNDPRISFYEINVSNDDFFSAPEVFSTIDTFFALEGITTVKFVRVRGVRLDGEAGRWSDTGTIDPSAINAPKTFSFEFYPSYGAGEDPKLKKSIIYGGGINPEGIQEFYTLLSQTFYTTRDDGGLSIWGYVSNRLRKFQEAVPIPWDRIRFSVNGIHRLDSYFSHWTNRFDIINTNKNDFDPNHNPITFYAKGGYTAAFGPYGVDTPNSIAGVGGNDARRVTAQEAPLGKFYWFDPLKARYPARFQEAQLPSFSDTRGFQEAGAFQIAPKQKTHWLIFQDFNFQIPEYATILGIQADIKKRQPNQSNDEISANLGILRPDRAFGDDLVLEHLASGGATNATRNNIINDINFGKYLDLSAGHGGDSLGFSSGRLLGDVSGNGNDGSVNISQPGGNAKLFTGKNFSMSAWIIAPSPISSPPVTRTHFIIGMEDSASVNQAVNSSIQLTANTSTVTNAISQYRVTISVNAVTADATFNVPVADPAAALRAFHLVTFTWDGTVVSGTNTGQGKLYVDGILRVTNTGLSSGRTLSDNEKALGVGTDGDSLQGQSFFGQAHVGIWNNVLSQKEITSMFANKGNIDYRFDFDQYISSKFLNHYFLVFPNQANIKDSQIRLVDFTGVRTDLDNKAITTESWPQLGQFFYTTVRQFGVLPLASSDGIPHDNHLAIGYQTYGGLEDLWGAASWTPAQVNDFYFGLAIQAVNSTDLLFRNNAFVDHAKLTIYTEPVSSKETDITVSVASANAFYFEREFFGGLINIIDIGA